MRAPLEEDDFRPGSDVEDSEDEAGGTPGAYPERSESAYY